MNVNACMPEASVFKFILKILRADECASFVEMGHFDGAQVDLADGFIHLSTERQVAETASKHFKGEPNLWLIALESSQLAPDLRWETSRGGELFPHLYRPFLTRDVLWIRPLPLESDGRHAFPAALTDPEDLA